jgi:hypothetical protein
MGNTFFHFSMQYLLTDYTDEEAQQFTPDEADLPGGIEVNTREYETLDPMGNNQILIWCNFLGIPGATDEPPKGKTQYRKRGRWLTQPIEAFPDQTLLASQYGAYNDGSGKLKFPQYRSNTQIAAAAAVIASILGGAAAGVGVFAGTTAGTTVRNPLYGCTSYPVSVRHATKSYIRRKEPEDLFDAAGTVIDKLPEDFPNADKGGPWLVNQPEVTTKGNCVEIIESFDELDELVHVQALYDLIKKKTA